MTPSPANFRPAPRWHLRDYAAALGLFLAAAAVTLWQCAHLVILWDLSYTLDSSLRIAQGQMPYRDFPFVHAPLTFLLQAALIRLTGCVYLHHVLYAAVVGGLGTVLAWRILLESLRSCLHAAWPVALLLAAPLTVLGIYSILPMPSYDCDTAFFVLFAVFLLQRVGRGPSLLSPFVAGVALVLPLFFKQNIGLPMLAVALGSISLLWIAASPRCKPASEAQLAPACSSTNLGAPSLRFFLVQGWESATLFGRRINPLVVILIGALTALGLAALLIQSTAGLSNYLHWTLQFAMQRRLPALGVMIGIYQAPSLPWKLACVAAGVLLLRTPLTKKLWTRLLALALLAAPFLWTLFSLVLLDDADDRADSLLALWPLLLVLSASLTVYTIFRRPSLRALIPLIVLAAIHGTLLSQQIWGSTYAIWPLLMLLIAEMIAAMATTNVGCPILAAPLFLRPGWEAMTLTAIVAATLAICGALYTVSEERLSYLQLPDGPAHHATLPALAGMNAPGPYLPDFEELLRFAAAEIPANDGLILLPGEDPFYFASGRTPQFPVLLFDPSTDPYSTAQAVAEARRRQIRWLIVKHDLQIKQDVTPDRALLLQALFADFAPYRKLRAYDVYRRR